MNGRTSLRFSRRAGEQVPSADYASAVEIVRTRRMVDIAFGLAMAVIVALTIFVLLAYRGAPT